MVDGDVDHFHCRDLQCKIPISFNEAYIYVTAVTRLIPSHIENVRREKDGEEKRDLFHFKYLPIMG